MCMPSQAEEPRCAGLTRQWMHYHKRASCKLGAVPASFFRSFVHKHRSMQHAAEYQYLHFATPELWGRQPFAVPAPERHEV